ncbi:MAG: dTMP kinase [candidate division KSB1 bacterium]|nr:dTMP kinase [candidate division KSB1 bacterium]MDQ7064531.1 dTMP kinase [candidate division KSB1 bacterium]
MFITFEGIDFSGKTTQAKKLIRRLQNMQVPVMYVREPGGTKISEAIRDILLDRKNLEMHANTELLLYMAARSQIVQEIIKPALQAGNVVICDRYIDSSMAYQGYGRGLDLVLVRQLNDFATTQLKPDMTFLLDISPDLAAQRRQRKGRQQDRMEIETREFHARIRDGYLKLAEAEPQRFVVLNGELASEEIHRLIWQKVEPQLNQR